MNKDLQDLYQQLPPIPIQEDTFFEGLWELTCAFLPSILFAILSWAVAAFLGEQGASFYVIGLFVILGTFGFYLMFYSMLDYERHKEKKRKEWEWVQNTYSYQLHIVHTSINNITLINKARDVNVIQGQAPSQTMTYPQVDREKSETYKVAVIILREAITHWNLQGKRPKEHKPIAFDAITKLVKTGHTKWSEANQMLEDARVLVNGTRANWEPLVKNETQAIQQLNNHLVSQGYYPAMNEGETEWRISIPQTKS